MTRTASPITYPLVVIDFEASALTLESYPIEVGIAILPAPSGAITSWSTLIKPDPAWPLNEQWDPDAQKIHKISRTELRDGIDPAEAMRELNARIPAGAMVWCDGGHYDLQWLRRLADAAQIAPHFELADINDVLLPHDALNRRYRKVTADKPRAHRAGADAFAICAALAVADEPPARRGSHVEQQSGPHIPFPWRLTLLLILALCLASQNTML